MKYRRLRILKWDKSDKYGHVTAPWSVTYVATNGFNIVSVLPHNTVDSQDFLATVANCENVCLTKLYLPKRFRKKEKKTNETVKIYLSWANT